MFLILVAVGAGLCSAQTAGKKYYLRAGFSSKACRLVGSGQRGGFHNT